MRFDEIRGEVGNVESSVRSALLTLIEKDLVIEESPGKVYLWNPEKTATDLELVRSYTIDELRGKE